MKRILHILTNGADKSDAVAAAVIEKQRSASELEVVVVDVTAGEPDYRDVVHQIFKADSVEVW